jgi:HTH-type transcriptional regulator / antitoxin HigA
MDIKKINNEVEYKNAVKYLEELGDNPNFEKDIKLKEEFGLIEKLVEDFDIEHYPIERSDPIDVIKLKMKYLGLKQKDLIPAIGSKGVVSDVLNKKRQLSKNMIRNLSELLKISHDILIIEYKTSTLDCIKSKKNTSIGKYFDFQLPDKLQQHVSIFALYVTQKEAFF